MARSSPEGGPLFMPPNYGLKLPSRLAALARDHSCSYIHHWGQRGQDACSQLNPVR
jgi:hypothetical protein